MSLRLSRTWPPTSESAALGFAVGFGSYVSLRLIGERVLVGVLAPVVWLVPIIGLLLGVLRERVGWRDRPSGLGIVVALLAGASAGFAHEFPFPFMVPGDGIEPSANYRAAAELLAVLVLLPVPFGMLGHRLSLAWTRATRPAESFAAMAAGLAAGNLAALGAVVVLGGYLATLGFLAGITFQSDDRRWTAFVLATCVASGTWIGLKSPRFASDDTASSWTGRAWSADQKLDRLTGSSCDGWILNNVLMASDCPRGERPKPVGEPLLVELGATREFHDALYLGFGAPRSASAMLASLTPAASLTFVTPEPRLRAWLFEEVTLRDREGGDADRLSLVTADPRTFLERDGSVSDLVVVDGVDVPFVASLLVPVPRSAWLFTREGYQALARHLSPEGVVLVERFAATPADLSRLLGAAPRDFQAVWGECPPSSRVAASLPCVWIAFTRSDTMRAAVERAFATTPGSRLLEIPASRPARPATDVRPIVVFPETLYVVVSAVPLVIVLGLLAPHRRRLRTLDRNTWARSCLSGLSVSLGQLATSASLGRTGTVPGVTMLLLLAANWAGVALAGVTLDRWGTKVSALRRTPFWRSTAVVAAAAAVALIALAVASPYPSAALGAPLALATGWLGGLGWSHAITEVTAGRRGIAFGAGLVGFVLGLVVAPALIAAHGFDLMVSVAAVCGAASWRGSAEGPPSRPGADVGHIARETAR